MRCLLCGTDILSQAVAQSSGVQCDTYSLAAWMLERRLVKATGEAQEAVRTRHLVRNGHPEAERAEVMRKAAVPVRVADVLWAASSACREQVAMRTFVLSACSIRGVFAHAAAGDAAVWRVKWLSRRTVGVRQICQGCS